MEKTSRRSRRQSFPAAQTSFNLLGALSFSHFLNDMMQSVDRLDLSACSRRIPLEFSCKSAPSRLTYQALRFAVAAAHRRVHRQASQAVFLERRHVLHTDRHGGPWPLRPITPACSPPRPLIGAGSAIFQSRVLTHCPPGLRRTPRSGAIHFPGGWKTREVPWGRCLRQWIILPHGQSSLAWFAIAAVIAIAVLAKRRRLVQEPTYRPAKGAPCGRSKAPFPRTRVRLVDCRAGPVDLLEVLLRGQYHQLLQLLFDREISRLGALRSGSPVHIPAGDGARHAVRRTLGRPHRPQACHLGVDSRHRALHLDAAPMSI